MLGDAVAGHGPVKSSRTSSSSSVAGLGGLVDVGVGVPGDDRDLAGQLGDRDGFGVAAPTPAPTADRRCSDRSVLRQQLGDRYRPCAAVAVFWSCHRVLPLGLAASSVRIAYGRLHQCGSVGFAVEFPQDKAFSQRPRADVHGIDRQRSHARLRNQRAGHDLWRPLGTHSFQLCSVSRGHPRDESYELPKAVSCQCPLHPRSRPGRRRPGESRQRAERLRGGDRKVGGARLEHLGARVGQLGVQPVAQHRHPAAARRIVGQPLPGQPARAERQRQRHLRLLVDPVGQLQRTAADVDVDDPARTPAVPAAHRQEGEPGLVDPAEHLQRHAGLGQHAGQHVLGVLGVAHGRGGERHQLRAARAGGDLGELVDGVDQLVGALAGQLARADRWPRPAAATPWWNSSVSGGRRGGRRPPTDERCCCPRRARPVARIQPSGRRLGRPVPVRSGRCRLPLATVAASEYPGEVELDFAREWVEFYDPDNPEHLIAADHDLAAVAVDVRVRHAGLQGHRRGPARRRLLLARRVPVRRGRPRAPRRRGADS